MCYKVLSFNLKCVQTMLKFRYYLIIVLINVSVFQDQNVLKIEIYVLFNKLKSHHCQTKTEEKAASLFLNLR